MTDCLHYAAERQTLTTKIRECTVRKELYCRTYRSSEDGIHQYVLMLLRYVIPDHGLGRTVVTCGMYSVSQKTSYLWLAITLTYVNSFLGHRL